MQVRTIEFQESFGRVAVETSRQQSLLLREPEMARQQVAMMAASERALNLTRPMPATQPENTIIDPNQRHTPERHPESGSRDRQSSGGSEEENAPPPGTDGVSGTRIDVVA